MPSLVDPALSDYGSHCTHAAPVQRLIALFSSEFRPGLDVNLAVGFVNEDTLPTVELQSALATVFAHPGTYRNALNYGGAAGSPNLHRSLTDFLVRNRVGGLDAALLSPRRMIVGVSGATSILEAFAAILPRGLVVTSDPYYYIYAETLARHGFEILALPEDEHGMQTSQLVQAVGDRLDQLRFVYVSTIGNPTSTVLSNPRRRELVDLTHQLSAQTGRKIPLIFDTAYETLVHCSRAEPPVSGLAFDREGLVYEIGSLSKVLAPALRLGYLIGPDSTLLRAFLQRATDIGFSAPLLNQELASVLLDQHGDELLRRVHSAYRAKSRHTRALLERELGPELETLRGGEAGFYYYLTLRDVATDEGSPFYRYCSRTTGDRALDELPDGSRGARVSYLPGAFCTAPTGVWREVGKRQLRISYGFEDPDGIQRGIAVMREACRYARTHL